MLEILGPPAGGTDIGPVLPGISTWLDDGVEMTYGSESHQEFGGRLDREFRSPDEQIGVAGNEDRGARDGQGHQIVVARITGDLIGVLRIGEDRGRRAKNFDKRGPVLAGDVSSQLWVRERAFKLRQQRFGHDQFESAAEPYGDQATRRSRPGRGSES